MAECRRRNVTAVTACYAPRDRKNRQCSCGLLRLLRLLRLKWPAGGKGFVRLNAKQPALRYLSRLLLKLPPGCIRTIGTAWDGLGRHLGRQNAEKRQCLCGLGRWDGSHRGTCLWPSFEQFRRFGTWRTKPPLGPSSERGEVIGSYPKPTGAIRSY